MLVGADDPAAMVRHTRSCRALGLPFAADPSQQLARVDGGLIRERVDGADHVFTNEYEHALLLDKTGWRHDEVLARVGTWVTTLGERGSRIERAGEQPVEVPAVPVTAAVDPTGVGDAYRAGYLAALGVGAAPVRRGRLGSTLAALALSTVGTQTYDAMPYRIRKLLATTYGPETGHLPFGGEPV